MKAAPARFSSHGRTGEDMSQITIGKAGARTIHLDVDVVLKTRLLIQGGSGSGKSWLIRRLAEQLFGKLPVIIIDPEGEFATLREKFGYVLVGPGGETPLDSDMRLVALCQSHEALRVERDEARAEIVRLKQASQWQPIETGTEGWKKDGTAARKAFTDLEIEAMHGNYDARQHPARHYDELKLWHGETLLLHVWRNR
jgi:hypothetical protein